MNATVVWVLPNKYQKQNCVYSSLSFYDHTIVYPLNRSSIFKISLVLKRLEKQIVKGKNLCGAKSEKEFVDKSLLFLVFTSREKLFAFPKQNGCFCAVFLFKGSRSDKIDEFS